MEDINFELIAEHVSTKYGDLTGVIQIDGHDNISSIYELCKDAGVDTSEKFIIGFGLDDSSIAGVGESASAYCRIIYVDENIYGNTFDEIQKRITNDGGNLKAAKISFTVPYQVLGKYIKRLDFLAMSELTASATSIEIDEG